MLYAHCHASVFDRIVKSLARAALAVNLQSVATEYLKMRGYRDVNVTVKRVAKKRAALLFNSDDAHRQAAYLQRLSDRIDVGEKLVFDVAAQYHHERGPLHFVVGDKASVFDRFVFDLDHV
jgi:hypothetical protein